MGRRVYLDWNASAPLRPEARQAVISALDAAGNPSSVHFEGRSAKALLERARAAVGTAFGMDPERVVFTSGATEAAALALAGRNLKSSGIEHEAVLAWTEATLETDEFGRVTVEDPESSTLQMANGETGILQDVPEGIQVSDATQAAGRIPLNSELKKAAMAITSAHKLGGPKGIGALLLGEGRDVEPRQLGGGQEMGRRSGTENPAAAAGFGAAVAAAAREVDDGDWERVEELRDELEVKLMNSVPGLVVIGRNSLRLPNTSCFALSGWKSELQVIQLDLDGYSISAGSACSSGRVGDRNALRTLGLPDDITASAVRVSFGPSTPRGDVMGFADAWIRRSREHAERQMAMSNAATPARAA